MADARSRPTSKPFLLHRITTYESLRVATWLARQRGATVASAEVCRELGMSEAAAQEALDALVDADLVARFGSDPRRYRYAPSDPEVDQLLRRTSVLLEQNEIEVLRTLATNSIARLRGIATSCTDRN